MNMKNEKLFRICLFAMAAALAVMACAAAILFTGPGKEKKEIKDFVGRNEPSKIVFQKTGAEAACGTGRKEIDELVDTGKGRNGK